VRLVQTEAGTGAAVNIGRWVYSKATNIRDSTHTTPWESVTLTGSHSTAATYSAKRRRVGDTEEYDVRVAYSGGTDAATFTLTLPRTIDTAKLADGGSRDRLGSATFYDNSAGSAARLDGEVIYNSSTTVAVNILDDAAATDHYKVAFSNSAPVTIAASDKLLLKFAIPVSGWNALSSAVTPDQQNWFVDVSETSATYSLGTTSQSNLIANNASGTLVIASGSLSANITCSGGNAATSTTCSAGNEQTGIEIPNIPSTGLVEACFEGFHFAQDSSAAANIAVTAYFEIITTSGDTSDTAVISTGTARLDLGTNSAGGGEVLYSGKWLSFCRNLTLNAGSNTIKVDHDSSISGTVGTHSFSTWRMRIKPLTVNRPTPLFTSSVSSAYSTGVTKRSYYSINCDGASSELQDVGSAISGITNISSGACTWTAVAQGATRPVCQWSAIGCSAASGAVCVLNSSTGSAFTTTAGGLKCVTDTGATCTAFDAEVSCDWPL
jgi:hypothetical protein